MLSIRMIIYNQEQYIVRAIESVLKQKVNFRYELLIGDDASTDSTSDITDYYRKNIQRLLRCFIERRIWDTERMGRLLCFVVRCGWVYL